MQRLQTVFFLETPERVQSAVADGSLTATGVARAAALEAVDTLKTATLEMILQGRDPATVDYVPTELEDIEQADTQLESHSLPGGAGVIHLPHTLLDSLRTLPARRVKGVAERWALTDEWRWDRFDAKQLRPSVEALRALAAQAGEDDELYLWWSP